MMTDEELAAEYQERAQTLRRRADGAHLDDKTRADLIRKADECAVIVWELAPRRRFDLRAEAPMTAPSLLRESQ